MRIDPSSLIIKSDPRRGSRRWNWSIAQTGAAAGGCARRSRGLHGAVCRAAGDKRLRLELDDSAWKDDDCRWFERYPKRSHRFAIRLCRRISGAAPHGPSLWVIVRQAPPGMRVRLGYPSAMRLRCCPMMRPCLLAFISQRARKQLMPSKSTYVKTRATRARPQHQSL